MITRPEGMPPEHAEQVVAAVDMLGRTGAGAIQLRFSHDEEPVVWLAVALYEKGTKVAAGLDPLMALLHLCEKVVDGATCTHCERQTAFLPDDDDPGFRQWLIRECRACVYGWDSATKRFARSCQVLDQVPPDLVEEAT